MYYTSDPCSSGDIRLWGGETESEGNIEICTDHGVWSAVCDEYWDTADAAVACRQLNYTNPSKKTSSSFELVHAAPHAVRLMEFLQNFLMPIPMLRY